MKVLRDIAIELRLLRQTLDRRRELQLELDGSQLVIENLQERLNAKGPTYSDGYNEGYGVGYDAGLNGADALRAALSSPVASASQSHPNTAAPSFSPPPTE